MSSAIAANIVNASIQAGISEWVICPGARNVELMAQLSQTPGLKLWTHFDERSAGFFALGRTMWSLAPIAVLCTSGTAVAELLPAVIEAHYQGRPLLVVSADREPSWRGSGAPQAIIQPGIFSHYTPQTIDIDSPDAALVALANWDLSGPFHLNVCLPEPRLDSTPRPPQLNPQASPPQLKSRINIAPLAQFLRDDCWNGGLVLVGGLDEDEIHAAEWLVNHIGMPVKADATSGLRGAFGPIEIFDADYLMQTSPPGAVLRLGDVPTDRCWRDLESRPEIPVLSICRTGYAGLNRPSTVIRANVEQAVRALGEVERIGDRADTGVEARKRTSLIGEALRCFPESEQSLIHEISLHAAVADMVYLGNSMPIRQWNLFAQHDIVQELVFANRGANGIDGQISTFLGCSANVKTAWAIFGDLTALYDSNGPALALQLPEGRRIAAVINNSGGRIFESLPGGQSMRKDLESLLVQPHNWSMQGIAQQWNCHYRKVTCPDDLDFEPQAGLTILEIFPDLTQTRQLADMIRAR